MTKDLEHYCQLREHSVIRTRQHNFAINKHQNTKDILPRPVFKPSNNALNNNNKIIIIIKIFYIF